MVDLADEELYRSIIETCADAIVITDRDQRIAYINRAAEATFGRSRQSAVGQPLDVLLPERFRTMHPSLVSGFAGSGDVARFMEQRDARIYGLRADGTEFPVNVSILRSGDGSRTALVAIVRDVTAQADLEHRLERLASTDPLTGILNRRTFVTRAEQELSRASRYHHPVTAAMVDIDRFKRINDRLGHTAGDAAICHVCRVIETHIRQSDLFGRWGGEEFVVLLPETDEATALAMAERLRRDIAAAPFAAGTAEPAHLTVSIGIAQARGERIDDMIGAADQALYRAKRAGRNRCVVAPDGGRRTRSVG